MVVKLCTIRMNSHKLVQFGNLEVNIVCTSMCDILFSGCLGMQIDRGHMVNTKGSTVTRCRQAPSVTSFV